MVTVFLISFGPFIYMVRSQCVMIDSCWFHCPSLCLKIVCPIDLHVLCVYNVLLGAGSTGSGDISIVPLQARALPCLLGPECVGIV